MWGLGLPTMQTCTNATYLQDTPFSPRPTYGVLTTERDRPSMKTTEGIEAHGIPFSPNNQMAYDVSQCVLCAECLRPRVLHSKHKLSLGDKVVLERTLEDVLFSCGSNFKDVKPLNYPSDSPQTKSLLERVFVRENLNYGSHVLLIRLFGGHLCSLCMQQRSYLNWSLSHLQLLLRRGEAKYSKKKKTPIQRFKSFNKLAGL